MTKTSAKTDLIQADYEKCLEILKEQKRPLKLGYMKDKLGGTLMAGVGALLKQHPNIKYGQVRDMGSNGIAFRWVDAA